MFSASMLHYAVMYGSLGTVRALVSDVGFDVNIRDAVSDVVAACGWLPFF
jgi:hypothetical protein